MPKQLKSLTARAVQELKALSGKNRRVMVGPADCAGLHLRIEGGTKSWALRIKVGDKRRDIGLGPYHAKIGLTDDEGAAIEALSLEEARNRARELRNEYRKTGAIISPTQANADRVRVTVQAAAIASAKDKTFKQCALLYLDAKLDAFKNEKHKKQWSATLETYAYPAIGDLSVAAIDRTQMLEILRPIWTAKNETASRLRGRMEKVFDWAKVEGYRTGDNPASWKGNLEHSLTKRQKLARGHHAALPYAHIGAFMTDLGKRDGLAARALELAIMCASRSQEVRLAEWSEMDLEGAVWTIPASRMKAGKEHRVPLAKPAVALLKALPRFEGNELVFPAPRGGAMSDMALTAVLKRMDRGDLTQHGFRSTFRDWAGETTSYPREVIEHALAHQLADKAEAAYQRGTLFPKRVKLMESWATRCGQADDSAGNVVPLKGVA
ncbi:MAG: site-specific integrase [Sphingobacteriales bacterium]|nr:MAG: site-specific integrase [Sphingobacteriales bacterium]